ncbi:MAG: GNAT family N-acetyltransferase [Anaerolineae bacterium]|nr:GNAT family N-acetyltransferase [Anaerolineae bacterium]
MPETLNFVAYSPADNDQLIAWLTSDTWQYHGYANPTPEFIRQNIDQGVYSNDSTRTIWVMRDEDRVGLLRLDDLGEVPSIDIRIRSAYRGQSIGEATLRWLAEELFTTLPEIRRIEGITRQDNTAMRRLFRKCGFVKEAHYRQGWIAAIGSDVYYDGILYGLLRQDWQTGTTTPVNWHDE